ncbi:MAG TPA: ribonuclease domain-containing protein [Dermatophilaceae bacterium]|nr:ribonuclease domain-containing protein [Dermatophilaceae bacterium]
MTRAQRQTWQLVGVALLVLAIVVVALWLRGSGGSAGTAPAAPAPSAAAGPSRGASAGGATDPASGLRWVDESALPAQARETLALIRKGGPYPYPRNDDQTFGNREGILPKQPSGFYKEYTVVTPGSADRGERRIIVGKDGAKYYTDDHYDSFRRIREDR